jgi:uncharacterized surface protein with fasciclin (FAS1) repeats
MSATRDPDRTGLGNLAEAAWSHGALLTFMRAIERGGLEPVLAALGPLTVFAPSDDAFAGLPPGTVDSLLGDQVKLNQVLTYHLAPGRIEAASIVLPCSVPTINGERLPLSLDASVQVDGAFVVEPDLAADNGIIHIIDRVLLPAMM